MNIVLYSTGCPKCKVLKQKLDSKAIAYTENNTVSDMMALGIQQVPILEVDGELLSFTLANEWINKYQNMEATK
jgi:glutaredoxin